MFWKNHKSARTIMKGKSVAREKNPQVLGKRTSANATLAHSKFHLQWKKTLWKVDFVFYFLEFQVTYLGG